MMDTAVCIFGDVLIVLLCGVNTASQPSHWKDWEHFSPTAEKNDLFKTRALPDLMKHIISVQH